MTHQVVPLTKEDLDLSLGVFTEHFNHQFERVVEAIETIEITTNKIPRIEKRLERVAQKVETIELVVTATSKDIQLPTKQTEKLERVADHHDKRITKLEATVT